jgi:hypothetical protein
MKGYARSGEGGRGGGASSLTSLRSPSRDVGRGWGWRGRLEGLKFENAVVGLVIASRLLFGPKVPPAMSAHWHPLALQILLPACRHARVPRKTNSRERAKSAAQQRGRRLLTIRRGPGATEN